MTEKALWLAFTKRLEFIPLIIRSVLLCSLDLLKDYLNYWLFFSGPSAGFVFFFMNIFLSWWQIDDELKLIWFGVIVSSNGSNCFGVAAITTRGYTF